MLEDLFVGPDKSVREVVSCMEENNRKAVMIVDKDMVLLGLFTLGDMRHFFLNNGSLSSRIADAMNRTPITFSSEFEVEEYRKKRELIIYPIVDEKKRVIDAICDWNDEKISNALSDIPVVIMAGGKGTRLYPYTKILPKPLIPIGDLTITERIIHTFERYGCKNFYMILNHKANMIRAYMSEAEKDYHIGFVEEKEFLGTAGGLKLIQDKIHATFFLSNCDILIHADLECIYKTHKAKGNKITFVCSMKDIVIPYGVVETDEEGMITQMKEKPGFSFLINTGLYMIEPDVLDDIEEGEYIHLPDLAQRYLKRGEKVGVFPISEKAWLDMGQFKEMENMMKSLGL